MARLDSFLVSVIIVISGCVIGSTAEGQCRRYIESNDCTFYRECVQDVLARRGIQCDEESDYPIGYGAKYCNKFGQRYFLFSRQGKIWVDETRKCLMKKLYGRVDEFRSCNGLAKYAFDTHVDCYVNSGPGFCDIVGWDFTALCSVFEVGDFIGRYRKEAIRQVVMTMVTCVSERWDFWDFVVNPILWRVQLRTCIAANIGSMVVDLISNRGKRSIPESISDSHVASYASAGACEFWEALEDKFPCQEKHQWSLAYSTLLPMCNKFSRYGSASPSADVGAWMARTQQCLMRHALPFYQNSSVDCLDLDFEIMNNTVPCMVEAGFCALSRADEFFLSRGLELKGYPVQFPEEYTTLPLTRRTTRLTSEYFVGLKWFSQTLSDANTMCYHQNLRSSPALYENVFSPTYGVMMKMRTEL